MFTPVLTWVSKPISTDWAISTKSDKALKLFDQFSFVGSNISSMESNANIRIGKSWTAINRFSVIWKSGLSDKIKRDFFHAVTVLILLFDFTPYIYRNMQKKLDRDYTRMLRTVLNKSWGQHPTKQLLNGHRCSISQISQVRQARHARYCRGSKDELINNIFRWTPTHGHTSVGRQANTYIYLLWTDTGCRLEYLPGAMANKNGLWGRIMRIWAINTTWWYFLEVVLVLMHLCYHDKAGHASILVT